jgi:hypothetical protein
MGMRHAVDAASAYVPYVDEGSPKSSSCDRSTRDATSDLEVQPPCPATITPFPNPRPPPAHRQRLLRHPNAIENPALMSYNGCPQAETNLLPRPSALRRSESLESTVPVTVLRSVRREFALR